MNITTLEGHVLILSTVAGSWVTALVNLRSLRALHKRVNGHLDSHPDDDTE